MSGQQQRPLGLFSLVCIGVNAIVGSSIFLFPGKLSGMLGPASVLAFGLTAVLLLPVALSFCKMAARFDRPGGPYLYATTRFGKTIGFGVGWLCWVEMLISWGAVAAGLGLMTGWGKPAAAGIIVLMGAVNWAGVRPGAWTSNVFAAAKLLPLAVFALAALPKATQLTPLAPHGWSQLGPACFMALFAYSGFEAVPVPAGEARDVQRNAPLAVLISLGTAAAFYMLVQLGVAGLGGAHELSEAAGLVLGAGGVTLITVGGAISMAGFSAGSALGGPRYLVALAEDGHLPGLFSKVRPAVALSTGLALTGVLLLDFERLVDFGAVVLCAQYLTTCVAAGGPAGWLGVAGSLWLGAQGGWQQIAGAAAALSLGFALRWARRLLPILLLAAPAWSLDPAQELVGKVDAGKLREFLHDIAKEPHVAGTPAGAAAAERVAARLVEHGLNVRTPRYEVLLSHPVEAAVFIGSVPVAGLEGTAKQGKPLDRLGWNAYSPSGDVTAPVVYANYARPEDYEKVDVKGKIVLARYSEGYRGGKTLEAEKRGAVGILFYSDPADDGYGQGDVLPKGPWGPADHVQRGSNVYDFIVPGDPETPGWPSTPGAKRLERSEIKILPRIPSLPLSWQAAKPILETLTGPTAPKDWRGALPLTYRLGPGAAIRMKVANAEGRKPIVNVVGVLEGREEPEKLVILSSHHDAWTRGAVDDGIGVAIVLELSRVFGQLAAKGWRPRRSLVFAAWDAEEYTLTGSTEWGEENAESLKKNAVALLNLDAYRWGGELTAIAVPSLKAPLRKAIAALSLKEPEIGMMGSGSDYTVFLNHLGVPCVETMFTGNGGVYHSINDEPAWVERVDPGLSRMADLAKLNGLLALELADSALLPLDHAAYAAEIKAGSSDPDVQAAAAEWEKAAAPLEAKGNLKCANEALLETERALLDEGGLPGRPWFKHQVYAPFPSYEPQFLPGEPARLAAALRRAAAASAKARACVKQD